MISDRKKSKCLAWCQMVFSIMLAATTVIGYIAYHASLGRFLETIPASIASISNVVGLTADAVEARQDLIHTTRQQLVLTRSFIMEFNKVALEESRNAPQYAESFRNISTLVIRASVAVKTLGDGLKNISAPSEVRMDGMKPSIVWTFPLEKEANELKAMSQEIRTVGEGIYVASSGIERNGKKLGDSFLASSEKARQLLEETDKTLEQLQRNDLPTAINEMRGLSKSLASATQEMPTAGQIGRLLLMIGLLLSGWCFLNSLNLLIMADQIQTTHPSNNAA